jgi:hypothetical protein
MPPSETASGETPLARSMPFGLDCSALISCLKLAGVACILTAQPPLNRVDHVETPLAGFDDFEKSGHDITSNTEREFRGAVGL